MLIAMTLVMILNFFLPTSAENTTVDDIVTYSARILGFPQEDIQELYAEYDGDQEAFMNDVTTMLADIVYYEQWNTEVTSNVDLDQFSQQYNVSSELLERHLNIVGSEYFLRNLNSYQQTSLLSNSAISPTSTTNTLFQQMYDVAHTGNLFLTKDSVHYNYRHGHVGIVSSHSDFDYKMIAEALGKYSDGVVGSEESEVVNRALSSWSSKITLAIYYPSDTTTVLREYAGFMGSQLDYCGYKLVITKGNAVDELPYVNCISLVYLAYYMSTDDNSYDLLPQVGNNSVLYPSQVQFSTIIALKTLENGNMARTANWNDYNWGFNFNG